MCDIIALSNNVILMNKSFLTIIFLFIASCIYSQDAIFVKGYGYEGYIFPKEHSIWGFPPEDNRYTPSIEDIAYAEKILLNKMGTDYVKRNQKGYCKPINKRTLNKYVRQYVGYLMDDGAIIIHIYLNRSNYIDNNKISKDIIAVFDGGTVHWSIKVNLSTGEIFDMLVNGQS